MLDYLPKHFDTHQFVIILVAYALLWVLVKGVVGYVCTPLPSWMDKVKNPISVLSGMIYAAIFAAVAVGEGLYFTLYENHAPIYQTWEGRVMHPVPRYIWFPLLHIAYQMINIVFELLEVYGSKPSTPAVIHHCTVIATGLANLTPMGMYYHCSTGWMDFSSVWLCLLDTFKAFPLLQTQYPKLNSFSRISFGVSFILCRVVGYPIIFYQMVFDMLAYYKAHGANSAWVMVFGGCTTRDFNILDKFGTVLCALQFYWGYLVINGLLKLLGVVKGSDKKKKSEKKDK